MRLRETVRVVALAGINAAPAAGTVLSLSGWLAKQFMSQISWIQDVPFGWLTAVFFALWMGQDVYHPNGRLRAWCRRLLSFGEFQNVITEREYFSLGSDHGGEQQFIAIYVPFVFSKERLLDLVIIRATITGYIASRLAVANRITMQKSYDHEWRDTSFIAKRYVSGSKIQIPIAFIPTKHGNHGVYGDKSLSGYYFGEGTAHFVEITLSSGKQRQRYTVQIFMPLTQFFNDPILGINSGRFVMFENEKLPTLGGGMT